MRDLEKSFAGQRRVRQDKPSENCGLYETLGANACNGSGRIWYKDMHRAIEQAREGYKPVYACDIKTHREYEVPIEWQEECACLIKRQREAKRNALMANAKIPESFKTAALNNYSLGVYKDETAHADAEVLLQVMRGFVSNYEYFTSPEGKKDAQGLYIYSNTKGSGKTKAAVTIANELIARGVDALFINATDISLEIRKTYKQNSDVDEAAVLHAFKTVPLLVIDDLAAEKPSAFIEEQLYKIFNARTENNLLTIITSNLTIEEFALQSYVRDGQMASYTDAAGESRIGSRLKLMCYEIHAPEEAVREREAEFKSNNFENLIFGFE